jgi:hypothetical protein
MAGCQLIVVHEYYCGVSVFSSWQLLPLGLLLSKFSVRLSVVRPSVCRPSGSVLNQKSVEATRWRAGSRSKTDPFWTFRRKHSSI